MKFLLLVLSCLAASALTTNPPQWPDAYAVSGVLTLPYNEITEPFHGWFDGASGRSRIDYYGGTLKTYQLTNQCTFGVSVQVSQYTSAPGIYQETCLRANGTKDKPIEVQSILPNAKDFQLVGTEQCAGYHCDRFNLTEIIDQKRNVYTLLVRYVRSPQIPDARIAIPVRYEMEGYSMLLNTQYDRFYIDYKSFDHQDIGEDVFEVKLSNSRFDCSDSLSNCKSSTTTFNPMKELIYPRSEEHLHQKFARFKEEHRKVYGSEQEHEKRLNVFRKSLRMINWHNNSNSSYTVGINRMADWTEEETKVLHGFGPSAH